MRVVIGIIFLCWALETEAQITLSEGEVNTAVAEEQLEVNESMHRLNLNEASREELLSSNLLTEQQADQLLAWRQRYGKLLSVYELQAIPEFTLELIQQWQAWGDLYVEDTKQTYAEVKTTVTYRSASIWPRSKGYATKVYPGLPWSSYFRVRHKHGDRYTIGLLLEQDAGEGIKWNTRNRQFFYDHFSAYVMLEKLHPHWKVILGDFRAGFGRGLVCGARASFMSGAAGMPLIFQPGIITNTSAAEYGYGSGIGVMWKKNEYGVNAFLSSRAMDTRLYEREGKYFVGSFLNSGLHRTASEQLSRMNTELTIGAVHVQCKFSSTQLGLTVSAFSYNHGVMGSTSYYKLKSFSGKSGGNASVDFVLQHGPALITGEAAIDARGKVAILLQSLLSAGKQADLGLMYLNYASGYYAPFALTIARHVQPENEKGLSLYADFHPSATTQIRLQASVYKIPWLTYATRLPATGSSYQIIFQRQYSKSALFKIQYRYRTEDQGLSGDSLMLPIAAQEDQHYLRAEFQYQVRAGIRVYAIGQHQRYKLSSINESGSVMALGVQQHWKRWKLRLTMVMFNTDSYASRMYVYEQGSGADFRFRALYGSGVQYIGGIKFRCSKAASISVKYSYMHLPGQSSSGSGYDVKLGDNSQEFSLQYNGEF